MKLLIAGAALVLLAVACGPDEPRVSSGTLAPARIAEYTTDEGTLCVVAVKDSSVAITCDWKTP